MCAASSPTIPLESVARHLTGTLSTVIKKRTADTLTLYPVRPWAIRLAVIRRMKYLPYPRTLGGDNGMIAAGLGFEPRLTTFKASGTANYSIPQCYYSLQLLVKLVNLLLDALRGIIISALLLLLLLDLHTSRLPRSPMA